jgi:hypothetical protein
MQLLRLRTWFSRLLRRPVPQIESGMACPHCGFVTWVLVQGPERDVYADVKAFAGVWLEHYLTAHFDYMTARRWQMTGVIELGEFPDVARAN